MLLTAASLPQWSAEMELELDPGCAMLGKEMLTIYERALRQGQPAVAEHLLCALEELVRAEPGRVTLDRAYLLIAGPGSFSASRIRACSTSSRQATTSGSRRSTKLASTP